MPEVTKSSGSKSNIVTSSNLQKFQIFISSIMISNEAKTQMEKMCQSIDRRLYRRPKKVVMGGMMGKKGYTTSWTVWKASEDKTG